MRISTIGPDELHGRFTRLQSSMSAIGLDRFIVSLPENLRYLTGVVCEPLERPLFLVVGVAAAPTLLVPALEGEHLGSSLPFGTLQTYREFPAPPGERWQDKLGELLQGAGSVGAEPSLRCGVANGLEECKFRMVPLVEELRIAKSKAEVELIRHAARFAELGVQRLLAASYSGSHVAEGFAQTRAVVAEMISEIDGWEPISNRVLMATWAAPRSAQPHSIPDLNDRLEEGPHIALVLTAVRGYAAECERTYFTSTPTPEVRLAFDVMLEARALAMEMTRPGTRCSEIDAAVNDLLRTLGYEANLLHRTGHGLGLARHAEAPWVAEGSEDVLAPGMVISIEPGIYLPGVGGIRHSDTILVTEDGYECLTHHPTDLESLTICGIEP